MLIYYPIIIREQYYCFSKNYFS